MVIENIAMHHCELQLCYVENRETSKGMTYYPRGM
jgi:hypothetical protein